MTRTEEQGFSSIKWNALLAHQELGGRGRGYWYIGYVCVGKGPLQFWVKFLEQEELFSSSYCHTSYTVQLHSYLMWLVRVRLSPENYLQDPWYQLYTSFLKWNVSLWASYRKALQYGEGEPGYTSEVQSTFWKFSTQAHTFLAVGGISCTSWGHWYLFSESSWIITPRGGSPGGAGGATPPTNILGGALPPQ